MLRLTFIQLPPVPTPPSKQANKQTNEQMRWSSILSFLDSVLDSEPVNRPFRTSLQCCTLETTWTHWSGPFHCHGILIHEGLVFRVNLCSMGSSFRLDLMLAGFEYWKSYDTSLMKITWEIIFLFLYLFLSTVLPWPFIENIPEPLSCSYLTSCLRVSFSTDSTPHLWPAIVWYSKLAIHLYWPPCLCIGHGFPFTFWL